MQYDRHGYIKKSTTDHNQIAKAAEGAFKKAYAKSRNSEHASTEARLAAEEAGATPTEAYHHARMAQSNCGGGY
jgi:hypothetical protein